MKKIQRLAMCVIAAAPFGAAVFVAAQETAPAHGFTSSGFTPITYFQDNCSRCHGQYGENYDLKHMAQSNDSQLKAVIDAMADGPGQSPLDDSQLEIETAFHRSLLDKKPFLIINEVTREDKQQTLKGEVTPQSKVEISDGKTTISAEVTDHTWKATLPADFDCTRATVIATKGETKTEVAFAVGYSHKQNATP